MLAAGTAGGSVTVKGIDESLLRAAMPPLREAGFLVRVFRGKFGYPKRPASPFFETFYIPLPRIPYRSFAPVYGGGRLRPWTTLFVDNVFENRFSHVPDLEKGGAEIDVAGNVALVYGKKSCLECMHRRKICARERRFYWPR